MEALQDGRRPRVEFPVAAEAVNAFVGDLGLGRKSPGVTRERFLRDVAEVHAQHLRNRAVEGVVDDIGMKPDGTESLRAAVAGQGRDAHLGHDLEQALFECVTVILRGGGDVDGLVARLHLSLGDKPVQRGKRNVGIDRRRAVTEQTGELVDIAAFRRFADEARPGALVDADEVMMDRAGGEEHRNRRMLRVDLPIAQNNERSAFVDGLLRLGADAVEVLLQAVRPFADGEAARHGRGMERSVL